MKRVVILGGGPAGCATALSLLAGGVAAEQIVLIEASRYERDRIGESIPPDTRRLFAELGVLEAFLAEAHEPSHGSASSWGSDELGYNDFVFNPYGHGWHLDRRRFDAWLSAHLQSRGVECKTGLRFLDVLEHGAEGALLALGDARGERERIHARFVVDATGARSHYARRMGARRRELDRLVSVAAFFRLPADAQFGRLTVLEAVEQGWWYTARLPDRRIAAAFASSHRLLKQHRFDRPRAWLEALVGTRHIIGPLAACDPEPGSLSVCTAPSFVLDQAYGEHWLAVGDAASAYDPISSQGVFKALTDGLSAGRRIVEFLGGRRDALVSHQHELEQRFDAYARQRAYFYEHEQRWPESPFWRERVAASNAWIERSPRAS
jgi:flavin-dependent dehydrogenase